MPHKTPQDSEMPCARYKHPTMHYTAMLMHDNSKIEKSQLPANYANCQKWVRSGRLCRKWCTWPRSNTVSVLQLWQYSTGNNLYTIFIRWMKDSTHLLLNNLPSDKTMVKPTLSKNQTKNIKGNSNGAKRADWVQGWSNILWLCKAKQPRPAQKSPVVNV